MLELEKELEAQRKDSDLKLKESQERENVLRQREKIQVERLLGLADVVGGNVLLHLLIMRSQFD